MKKFITYFLLLRTCWVLVEFLVLMASEKWIETATHSVGDITGVRVVFLATILLFTWSVNKFRHKFNNHRVIRCVLIIKTVILIMVSLLQPILASWICYFLVFSVALSNLIFVPGTSLVLEQGIPEYKKAIVLSRLSFLLGLVGLLSFLIGSAYLDDQVAVRHYLFIAALCSVLTLFFTSKCIKIAAGRNHLDQPADIKKPTMKNDVIGILAILVFFLFYQIMYKSMDPINTAYVLEILHVGQERQFRFIGFYFIGTLTVSLFIPQLVKNFKISYIFMAVFFVIATYMLFLNKSMPTLSLYCFMVIVGGMAGLINTAVSIFIHSHFKGFELAKWMGNLQWISAAGPFIAALSMNRLFSLTNFSVLSIAIAIALISILFFISVVIIKIINRFLILKNRN